MTWSRGWNFLMGRVPMSRIPKADWKNQLSPTMCANSRTEGTLQRKVGLVLGRKTRNQFRTHKKNIKVHIHTQKRKPSSLYLYLTLNPRYWSVVPRAEFSRTREEHCFSSALWKYEGLRRPHGNMIINCLCLWNSPSCEGIYESHAACRDKHFSSPYLTSREGNLCGVFYLYCLLADEIYSSLEVY